MVMSTKNSITTRTKPHSLPPDFEPKQNSVICCRGKFALEHEGNKKLKCYINQNLEAYSEKGVSKQERSSIVSAILQKVRQTAPEGGFVKFNVEADQWEEVGDAFAREKISQMLRDALSYKYPSSSKAKRRMNKSRKAIAAANTATATFSSSGSSHSSAKKPQQHDHSNLQQEKILPAQEKERSVADFHSKNHNHLPGFAFLRRDDPMVSISSGHLSTHMEMGRPVASCAAPARNVSLLETGNEATTIRNSNNQPASAPFGIGSSFAFPGSIAGSSSGLLPTRSVSLETGSAARQAASMMAVAANPPARSNSVDSRRLPTGNAKLINHEITLQHFNYNQNHNHNYNHNHNQNSDHNNIQNHDRNHSRNHSNPIFQWPWSSNNSNEPDALERINIEPLPMEDSIFQFWIDEMNNSNSNKHH